MEFFRLFSAFFAQRRRVLTVLLTVLTSVTTLTLVHKCVLVDTVRLQTSLPVKRVAQMTNGTVIASAELRLPRRDTVVVHDTILTTRVVTRWDTQRVAIAEQLGGPSSIAPFHIGVTRTATFRDSTFAGIISGTITAPPDSAPLGIQYRVTRPAFAPTVAFLQTKGDPVVVVSWQGEQVTLDHVIFHPEGSRWVRYVEATYQPLTKRVEVGGSVGMRWNVVGALMVGITQPLILGTGPMMDITVRHNL